MKMPPFKYIYSDHSYFKNCITNEQRTTINTSCLTNKAQCSNEMKRKRNDRTKKMSLCSRLSDKETKDQMKTKASLEK